MTFTPQVNTSPMIRPATPDDRSAILEVAVDSGLFPAEAMVDFGDVVAEQLNNKAEGHGWLVHDSNDLVSAAIYYAPETFTDGTYNLYFIAVRDAEKGRGLGSALLRHVEAQLRQNDARVLIIETSGLDGFALTRRFYLKHGYTEEARIRDFYAAGDDKVVFWRKL